MTMNKEAHKGILRTASRKSDTKKRQGLPIARGRTRSAGSRLKGQFLLLIPLWIVLVVVIASKKAFMHRNIPDEETFLVHIVSSMVQNETNGTSAFWTLPHFLAPSRNGANMTAASSTFNGMDNSPTKSNSSNLKIGACLVIMDDNHWLIEWLAYHYTTLPLTNLNVAVDPKSRTTPAEILSRWKDRMHIEVWWNWSHLSDIQNKRKRLGEVGSFRFNQIDSYHQCFRRHKENGVDWVLAIDTDEFYRPMSPDKRLADYLEKTPVFHSMKCVEMGRFQVGNKEDHSSNALLKQLEKQNVPLSTTEKVINGTKHDMLTTRFYYRQPRPMSFPKGNNGKNLVHTRMLEESDFPDPTIKNKFDAGLSAHRILHACDDSAPAPKAHPALFHYAGTDEQYNFRNDLRSQLQRKSHRYRTRRTTVRDTSLSSWLESFIATVGHKEAARLLEGVGKINPDGHASTSANSLVV